MTHILGIDPGSRVTGFGIIRQEGQQLYYVNSGCIRTQNDNFIARLGEIYEGVQHIVKTYKPQTVAIEKVFVKKNVESALKLGQARGAALCPCVLEGLEVSEYSPTQIKRTVVGVGRASKEQVQHMVMRLLRLSETPPSDAADALAIALCHVQQMSIRRLGLSA
ncbi:MAG: crossover junction endodeoxyribonuclease RuvC [Gammaproteobacteria bacterium]|nr:crossover junction endodeoxyribonuclease RuvC [Gammaproteobacteria bacterium]